jgi:hypothetical protein
MEFMTVTGLFDGRRYIAIYRKWFNDKLSAWELQLVPGTLRWDLSGSGPLTHPVASEVLGPAGTDAGEVLCSA